MNEVKKYLELEQLRLGEGLPVRMNVSEETKNISMPPAILLTLAENAVKHGAAVLPGCTLVTIESFMSDNVLALQLSNTGHYHPNNHNGIGL